MTWHATSSEARWLAAALVVAAATTGCGRKGDPLPPVVRVAQATTDLTVVQRADTAVLGWSYPSMTSVGGPLPDLEAIEVWRALMPEAQEPRGDSKRAREDRLRLLAARGELVRTLDVAQLDEATRGSSLVAVEDLADLPAEGGEVVWYAVRSRCCGGRRSEFSNIARLEPDVPPAPPTELTAEPGKEGVALAWSPTDELPVEIERSADGEIWTSLSPDPVTGGTRLDATAGQGRTWSYRLRSVRPRAGGSPVFGPPGAVVVVEHPDLYPPEAPVDLVCLPETDRVLLRWRAGADAVSYRVSRRSGAGPAVVIGDGLSELGLVDAQPPFGDLIYEVRAADRAGNLSEPASCAATLGGTAP